MSGTRDLDVGARTPTSWFRSWLSPRKRDLLLVPAGVCGLAWATLSAFTPDSLRKRTFILSADADGLLWVLSGAFVAILLIWALARCWLKPSPRVVPSLIRLTVSAPLMWLLGMSVLFIVVGLSFAFHSIHIRVEVEGRDEQLLLVVEPGLGEGSATLLRGGPFRYEIIGGPTLIDCWEELTEESIDVAAENSKLTLTAELSDSCDQSVPFRIPFILD